MSNNTLSKADFLKAYLPTHKTYNGTRHERRKKAAADKRLLKAEIHRAYKSGEIMFANPEMKVTNDEY